MITYTETIVANQHCLKHVLLIEQFFEDVFTEISERKFLVSRNQFIQVPYPHEKHSSFEDLKHVLGLFSYNFKRMYEYPDDAHQIMVKDLKSFMKSNTKSPGFFVPFIVDKMNTWTNIFDYGCLDVNTVDTPYAKRFNKSTFHPRCSREVVAKEKSNYVRGSIYGTTDHPIKYKNYNSSGLSLTNDDERE